MSAPRSLNALQVAERLIGLGLCPVALRSPSDPEEQKKLWHDMQQIYAKELPVVPLFFRAEPHVYPKWLKGYEPTGHGDWSSMSAENWRSE